MSICVTCDISVFQFPSFVMSLLNIPKDLRVHVISFLTREESDKLARVSKQLRNDVEHERYHVLWYFCYMLGV